jgi:hypothetical protein
VTRGEVDSWGNLQVPPDPLHTSALRTSISTTLCALVAALALGAESSRAAGVLPTLYFSYSMNCTFRFTDDSGKVPATIPPGTYQIEISTPGPFGLPDLSGLSDMTACKGAVNFRLTGPGVTLYTDLEYGDQTFEHYSETFQPGATYVAQDDHQPTVARAVFTAATTGSATTVPSSSSSSSSTSAGKGTVQKQIVGSPVVPFRGTLAATVDAAGKLALKTNGKPVGILKAGLYTFTVHDGSAKSGFTIQKLKASAITLTGVGYKGTHVKSVNLKAGQWTFFSPSGTKNYFIVVS